MKRVLLTVLAAIVAAPVWSGPIGPATAAPVQALDAGVEVSTPQEQIAPAGNLGVFIVTVSLAGPVPAEVQLVDSVTGGVIETGLSDISACGNTASINPAGDQFSCYIQLVPGATATLKFVVRSGLSSTSAANNATVSLQGRDTLAEVDIDESNNSSTASLPVTSGGSISFVPEGGSIAFTANSQTHALTVTEARGSGNGAIVSMTDPGQMQCGADACHGVRVTFAGGEPDQPFAAMTELDSAGSHDPCRGLGTAKCTGIYWRKTATDAMAELPPCGTEIPGDPCLITKFKSGSGTIHYLTSLDTDDPDIGLPGIPTVDGR